MKAHCRKTGSIEFQIRRREELGVEITQAGVDGYTATQEDFDRQVQYNKDLLAWTDANCRTDFDPKILGTKPATKGRTNEIDLHQRCLVDTLILSAKADRILITDDFIHHLPESVFNAISIEHYLSKYHNEKYLEVYSYGLIRLNYRGLTLQSVHLTNCFQQGFDAGEVHRDFHLALNSFSVTYNPWAINLLEILKFVHDLYAVEGDIDIKRKASTLGMRVFLTDLFIDMSVLEIIELNINELFASMPEEMNYFKEDIMSILNERKDDQDKM